MTGTEPGYTPPNTMLLGPEHIARYEATGGEEGYEWNGATCLVLTTTGRKTGEERKSALIFAADGDDFLIVASLGGAPKHPQWYLNLTANPDVTVQVKDKVFAATRAHRHRRGAPEAVGSRQREVAQLRGVRDTRRRGRSRSSS